MEPTPSPFEEQLRSLKFRTPPDALRQTVLARAMAAGQVDRQVSELSSGLTLWQRLESWIWPGPRAWAALASLWVVAAILQYASLPSGSAPSVTASLRWTAVPESMKLALLEQRKLRAELLGSEVSRSPLPRTKPEEAPPRPRSSIELSEMSA